MAEPAQNETNLGRCALITGGGQNIGRAVAHSLARDGFDIVVNGRLKRHACDAVADEIRALGRKAVVAMGDIGTPDIAKRVAGEALAAFGTVDVLAHHSSAKSFLAAAQTIRSMSRFEDKILGHFEPAICELIRFKKRYGNERHTAAGNAMDTYRKTAKGMLIQSKSGPYSTAYFAPAYMGNIWLDMVLNMTVLRYAATGMSVAVNNVKALESVFLDSDKVVSRVLVVHGMTRIPMQQMYDFLYGSDYDYECLPPSYIADGSSCIKCDISSCTGASGLGCCVLC